MEGFLIAEIIIVLLSFLVGFKKDFISGLNTFILSNLIIASILTVSSFLWTETESVKKDEIEILKIW